MSEMDDIAWMEWQCDLEEEQENHLWWCGHGAITRCAKNENWEIFENIFTNEIIVKKGKKIRHFTRSQIIKIGEEFEI